MLDFSHIPTPQGAATVETFVGFSTVGGGQWQTWAKPRGKSFAHILLVGAGGNGGAGAVGANSTAAGGGGGCSGHQTSIMAPLWAIPDTLFLSLGVGGGALHSYIAIAPNTTANNTLVYAGSGNNGANASGATAGVGGTSGTATSQGLMPLGWQWLDQVVAAQPGIIGGVAVAGGALTIPTTGLLVTGGTGGGGLPATATAGTAGGAFTVGGVFPAHAGGAAQATDTTPANPGQHGYRPIAGLLYGYGGTGGGSSHGSATGAGLFGGNGGDGAPGCGGGGGGGCLTGGVAGAGGKGGPAFCIITCW